MHSNIIAHRGLWLESKLFPNSLQALNLAIEKGFSVETDLRDNNKSIIIKHNPLFDTSDLSENLQDLESVIQNSLRKNYKSRFYLNIKSDGLNKYIYKIINKFPELNYTTFDQSIPDLIDYKNQGLNYSLRISPYEKDTSLQEPLTSIIFDPLGDLEFYGYLKILMEANPSVEVCVISPELHGKEFNRNSAWKFIKDLRINFKSISICTDLPIAALNYF